MIILAEIRKCEVLLKRNNFPQSRKERKEKEEIEIKSPRFLLFFLFAY